VFDANIVILRKNFEGKENYFSNHVYFCPVMKNCLSISFCLLFTVLASFVASPCHAQNNGGYMEYRVEGKDTVFVGLIKEAKVYARLPRQKGKAWRQYYRLIDNFNKVYPYALVGRKLMHQVDSTIANDELKRGQRDRYVREVEVELFKRYEDSVWQMTISQGMLLMRLVDRECGMCPYEIIKEYLNGAAAGFWQGVAKVFGADLKKRYDPNGMDANVEELVAIWDAGDWDAFYSSVFWKIPKKTVVDDSPLNSPAKKKRQRRSSR